MQARQPRQHVTHASMPLTPHTLARYPRKHATHATHASTSPMQARLPTLARHPRKHATHGTHASSNSTPFLKLLKKLFPLCFYASIILAFGR